MRGCPNCRWGDGNRRAAPDAPDLDSAEDEGSWVGTGQNTAGASGPG
ncbi:hypothetical protein QF034_006562 [Streptomyces africanus]|uniref:Uncharacterized protein n=1 Tax=Streptomyces africanus TaxID=231024 RepID=A0ABU0QY46_9ACTN|nr:hypothetical protein [Streptomyces africanus]